MLVIVRQDPCSEMAEIVGENGESEPGRSDAPREHAAETHSKRSVPRGNVVRKVSKF